MLIHKELHVTVSAKIFGDGVMKSWFSAMNISVLFGESKGKRQRVVGSFEWVISHLFLIFSVPQSSLV
jgi:hypothetical protein